MYEPLLYTALALTGLSVGKQLFRAALRHYSPKRKGMLGERRVNHILRTSGLRGTARLHNLLLPNAHATTQIDHVLVTQHGLFVIETKNLRGDISCDKGSSQWTQRMPSGKMRTFLDPTIQNTLHVRAITDLLQKDFPNLRCYPIVAFSDNANLVMQVPNVVNFYDLRLAIKARCSTEPIYSKAEVRAIAKQLKAHNIKSFRLRRQHDIRASLAAEAAKHQSWDTISNLYEQARNTPITYLGQAQDLPQRQMSREDAMLTDSGSFLRIGNRTGSIEDFLETAKRDERGLPVVRGAACDHFICPYTGDRFPFSEFKSFYRGLWAAYLTQNPQLVEHLQKKGAENIRTGVFRTDQALKDYLADPAAFLSNVKASSWYQNMAQKLSRPKPQPLSNQVQNAQSKRVSKQVPDSHVKRNNHTYTHS